MNIPFLSPISTLGLVTALGLGLSSVALAQQMPPEPPKPAATGSGSPTAAAGLSPQLRAVTQSSRVRAFNAGPSGEIRSLYLQNGSVVDVVPALGGQLGPAIRKGEKITVTGMKSEINGQSLVEAASIRLNDQTFSANASSSLPPAPGAIAGVAPPAPIGDPLSPPPPPRRASKSAAPDPCDMSSETTAPPPPDFGVPPPPPDGMAPPPPPPDGIAPPPPPQ